MKRLRRIIFNALTVLSLVLCVGTVVLWARSYLAGDQLKADMRKGSRMQITSARGMILCESKSVLSPEIHLGATTGFHSYRLPSLDWDREYFDWLRKRTRRTLGLWYGKEADRWTISRWLVIPHLYPVLLTAILPMLVFY